MCKVYKSASPTLIELAEKLATFYKPSTPQNLMLEFMFWESLICAQSSRSGAFSDIAICCSILGMALFGTNVV
jgi:hypothetical protein